MNERIETQGKTVDEAVNEALLRLGARRDEVDVTVLDEPKSGFLGLIGGRPAKVEVTRKRSRRRGQRRDQRSDDAHEFGEESNSSRSRRSGRNSRGGQRRGGNTGASQSPRSANANRDDSKSTEGQKRGDNQQRRQAKGSNQGNNQNNNRGGNRGKDQNNERRSRNQRSNNPQKATQETRRTRTQEQPAARVQENAGGEQKRPRNQRRSRPVRQDQEQRNARPVQENGNQERQPRRERPARQDRNARPARQDQRNYNERSGEEERQAPRTARVVNSVPDEILVTGISAGKYAKPIRDIDAENLNEALEKMTTGLLARAGFPARCEVNDGEYRQVRVITGDDSAGMLIGRHGATIDSVEHLVERMASNATGDRVRMNLDINNYRLRRHESLLERVEDAVNQIRESGKTYHVEPMNARERRIVHLAVEKYEGIRTFTMDSHRGRHVVIAIDRGEKDEELNEEIMAGEETAAMESPVENEAVEDGAVTTNESDIESPEMDDRPEA